MLKMSTGEFLTNMMSYCDHVHQRLAWDSTDKTFKTHNQQYIVALLGKWQVV